MAANEQEQDRSEPATPFKLQEARRRGQVARSLELSSWFMLATAVVLGWSMFEDLSRQGLVLTQTLFDLAGRIDLTQRTAENLFVGTARALLAMFSLMLLLIVVAALLGGFVQVGPVFSSHPLKPDFTRLNPVTGFKRIFNVRLLYETVKTLIKLTLVAAVLYLCVKQSLPALMNLPRVPIEAHPLVLQQHSLHVALWILATLGLIAALDFGFVKWEFAKKMRMSRRELREEIKRRDGDPKIKAKIRQLQREAAKRGASMQRVPDADVLLTNPTHLSVALKYERGKTAAPIVIAKGSGEMALRMREKARQCRVPILENRALARTLFRAVPIDAAIPPETYCEVARILMGVYRLRHRSA